MKKSSVRVRRGAGKTKTGVKYLAIACSLSALISACVGVVDSGSGTDALDSTQAGAVGVTPGGSPSAGAGAPSAGASNSAGGAFNVAGAFSTAGSGSFGNAGAGSFSSGGGASAGGSSFGGGANGGRNGMGGGANGGRAGMGAGGGSAGTTAVVCTSKTNWTNGNGPNMRPGAACKSCHNFTVAGTVYPTAHEPTNCNGVNGSTGVRVVITGSNGVAVTLTPGSSGDFYTSTRIATPFTVTLMNGGTTRKMLTPQTSGDCNSCHTQNGANGAPGRIMAP